MDTPRLTPQTVKVLISLYSDPGSSGAAICKATGLHSGTVYPILARLEEAGWIRGQWECADPKRLGRPRKRHYNLTAEGSTVGREEAARVASLYGRFAT